ncbi:MAG: hypothetical protein BYD32DRAFT_57020 [Podila humilis]|nr:MAG: hypothetical protein BYD32DRAFT_57020 [Podila humilis]
MSTDVGCLCVCCIPYYFPLDSCAFFTIAGLNTDRDHSSMASFLPTFLLLFSFLFLFFLIHPPLPAHFPFLSPSFHLLLGSILDAAWFPQSCRYYFILFL